MSVFGIKKESMRNLNELVIFEEVILKNTNGTNICCYEDQFESFMEIIIYKLEFIYYIFFFNLFILGGILYYFYRLFKKRAIQYTEDEYKTTVLINHMV